MDVVASPKGEAISNFTRRLLRANALATTCEYYD